MIFSQWTVWLANLDPIVGSEQGKTRPVLIISKSSLNSILPVVNVIPITSRKANRRLYPNEALLSPDSWRIPASAKIGNKEKSQALLSC